MVSNNYHAQLIVLFGENLSYFIENLGFQPVRVETNRSIGGTDVDIVVEGEEGRRALVEVKSHQGLVGKFERKQLPKYRAYDPEASIHVLVGSYDKSLELPKVTLKQYWPR